MISWIVETVVDLYVLLIIIYIIMTWVPTNNNETFRTIFNFLERICEPYLRLFRRFIPPAGGIDFSPIVAIVVVQLVARLLF